MKKILKAIGRYFVSMALMLITGAILFVGFTICAFIPVLNTHILTVFNEEEALAWGDNE